MNWDTDYNRNKKNGPRDTRAVFYARVSSKDQEKDGFSIPAQLKLLYEYARSMGFSAAREFTDKEIHLVKENAILSRDFRSHEKFIHGIKLLMAKNYIDNLSEEVRKGMTEKAEQGHWPRGRPLGPVPGASPVHPDRCRGGHLAPHRHQGV